MTGEASLREGQVRDAGDAIPAVMALVAESPRTAATLELACLLARQRGVRIEFRVLRSSAGETGNTGFMLAVDHQLVPGRVVLAADYASGKNAIGGGGLGVYYYLTKDSSLLVGPVWFNDRGLNGGMKWTTQWGLNF